MFKVHCVECEWIGYRKQGNLKSCPKCKGAVVWTFTGETKGVQRGKEILPGEIQDILREVKICK